MHKAKLKIIYHFRVRGVGAEGVHIAGIVNGFRSLGHEVVLVSPTNADPTSGNENMKEKAGAEGCSALKPLLHLLADHLPQPFFELMELLYNFVAIPKLWCACSREGVDYIYERCAFFNFSGAIVAQLKGIPLILEVNELSGYERVRGQFFVKFCACIERYVLRRSRLVVCVTDFLKENVQSVLRKKSVKVITVPNGIPSEWLNGKLDKDRLQSFSETFHLGDKRVICFVGGFVAWHNFDLLLEAFKAVHDNVQDTLLLFVGKGPLKETIIQTAEKLGLPAEAIVFTGEISHREVPYFLHLSEIAVIPETNSFRSPIKLFEYLGMGLTVIAPNKPAIQVAVKHEVNGLLFDPGDSKSLGLMVKKALQDRTLTNKLKENARLTVKKSFTWEKHAKRILHGLDEF